MIIVLFTTIYDSHFCWFHFALESNFVLSALILRKAFWLIMNCLCTGASNDD